jgi:hypothetical protein
MAQHYQVRPFIVLGLMQLLWDAFHVTADWLEFDQATNGHTFTTALLSDTGVVMMPDYKLGTCTGLNKLGIGQPYWWVN